MSNRIQTILLVFTGILLWAACSPKTATVPSGVSEPVVLLAVKSERIWKDTDTTFTKYLCPGKVFPVTYRLLDVDTSMVRKLLIVHNEQPGVITSDTILIEIPIPDGTWEKFRINQVQVMAPELAAKYPYLKTYSGTSLAYPADQIRLEANPEGIRAMILSTRGAILLDPFCKDDKLHMISYFKKNLPEGLKEEFEEK